MPSTTRRYGAITNSSMGSSFRDTSPLYSPGPISRPTRLRRYSVSRPETKCETHGRMLMDCAPALPKRRALSSAAAMGDGAEQPRQCAQGAWRARGRDLQHEEVIVA